MLKLRKVLNVIFCLVAAAVFALAGFNLFRPLPINKPTNSSLSLPGPAPANLSWPGSQSAVGTSEDGLLASHGEQKPVPIASVTKTITALAVLKQKPLTANQQGPIVTLDQTDLDYFNYYYANDGSVAQVAVGEKISERQMLEGMLLPSANNMADSLVRWAFGSSESYYSYANKMVRDLGMNDTTVGGASGFDDHTLSTASDLVKLGQAAMNNSVIASIVREETATVPVAGTIRNVNWLLGEDGVNGIKTGNTNAAGGCFLFSSERMVKGHKITLIGAIVGDTTLNQAISDSRQIINSADKNFVVVSVPRLTVAGNYHPVWAPPTDLVTKNDLSLLAWISNTPKFSVGYAKFKGIKAGSPAGTATLSVGGKSISSPIIASSTVPEPSLSWRLTRFK